jgi:peptidoglycan/LPS O-acetylase OafA/YrhL
MKIQAPHWPALDGLRGVASLAVMVYHFVPFDPPQRTAFGQRLAAIGHVGWIGVDLFFVLSGFLITGILLRARGGESTLRNFYARRVLRIVPLYYLALFAALVVVPLVTPARNLLAMHDTIDHQGWLWAYAYNLRILFTGHFWADSGIRLSHFWSLSVEEHFYLIWPLVVLWTDRRTLSRIAISVVLLVPVLRTVCVLAGVSHEIIYSFTLFRVDALLMGGLVALAVGNADLNARGRQLAPATVLACGACFCALAWRSHSSSGLEGPMEALGYSALALGSAAVIVLAIQTEATFLTRALSSRVLRWFGRYSYGAYVFHLILQPAISRWAPPGRLAHVLGSEGLGLLGHVGVGIGVTMIVAVASYHLYERPFLRLNRFFEYGAPGAALPRLPVQVAYRPSFLFRLP